MNTDDSLIEMFSFLNPTQSRGLETPEEKEPEIINGIIDVIIYPDELSEMTSIGLLNLINEIENVTDVKLKGVNDKIIATISYEAEKEDVSDDYFTIESKIESKIDEFYN